MKLEAKSRLSAAELTPKQEQLDVNQDGKISGDDLKKIREGKKPTKTEASNWKKDIEDINDDKLKAAVLKFGQSFKIEYVGTDGYNEDDMFGCEIEFAATTQAAGSYEKGLNMDNLKKITEIFSGFENPVLCHGDDGNFRMAIVGGR